MRLPQGPLDGAQPRDYVLGRLQNAGVIVHALGDDWYELTDDDGDIEVIALDDPIPARMIIHLWRRFGFMHAMLPTDLVDFSKRH